LRGLFCTPRFGQINRDHEEDSVALQIGFTDVERMMEEAFGILTTTGIKSVSTHTATEIDQLRELVQHN
jgi:hypothetical protein